MNSKQRVLTALSHQEPDRVPAGEIGIDWPITERFLGRSTYYRAKWKLQHALWAGKRDEVVASYKRDIVDLYTGLGLNVVPAFLVPPKGYAPPQPRFLDEVTFELDGENYVYTPETDDHLCVQPREVTIDDIQVPTQPYEPDESELELVRHVVRELGDTHFILGRGGDGTFPHPGGWERTLMNYILQPELIRKAVEAETAYAIDEGLALIAAGVDAILMGSDYCDNTGPMMSLRHFDEYIMPSLEKHIRAFHAAGAYVMKHTDGKTWTILDRMVEAGIDGYQAIQPSAGMDVRELKRRYGKRLTLMGAIECGLLVAGTVEEVRREVEYDMKYGAPGGGFILCSGNTVQFGAKYENFMAMLDTWRAKGAYPISI